MNTSSVHSGSGKASLAVSLLEDLFVVCDECVGVLGRGSAAGERKVSGVLPAPLFLHTKSEQEATRSRYNTQRKMPTYPGFACPTETSCSHFLCRAPKVWTGIVFAVCACPLECHPADEECREAASPATQKYGHQFKALRLC